MGQISVGNQIGALVITAVTLISNGFQPKQLEAYSTKDMNSLIKQLLVSMKICGLIGAVALVGFICVGKSFLTLWIPTQQIEIIYYIIVVVLIGDAIVSITTPLYYVMTLTLKMKTVCYITLGCGLLNVVSMIYLINKMASMGQFIIVGTTAILNIVALIIFPYLSKKYLELNENPFWKIIIKYVIFISLDTILAFYISPTISLNNWFKLISISLVIGIIFVMIYLFTFLRKKILIE